MTDCTTVIQQSQTRPRYDDFHQMDDMRITSYSLRYYLNTPGMNCPTTFPVQPTTRIQLSGDSWKTGKWRTDVESDLKGINRLNSRTKCDDLLYNRENNGQKTFSKLRNSTNSCNKVISVHYAVPCMVLNDIVHAVRVIPNFDDVVNGCGRVLPRGRIIEVVLNPR